MTKTAQHGDQAATDVTGKFWKAFLHKTYEIIDKVMKYEKLSALLEKNHDSEYD